MKKIKTTKALSLGDYVNKETGETLLSEIGKTGSLTVTQDTGKVIIDYEEYFMIDTNALSYLRQNGVISSKDESYLLSLFMTLKTEYNATYNYNIPHTLETLATLLKLNYDRTTALVKRLYNANIIHKYSSVNVTMYCINPFLCRRTKQISAEIIKLFNKFPVVTASNKKIILRVPKKARLKKTTITDADVS